MISVKVRECDINLVYSDRGLDIEPAALVVIIITNQMGDEIRIKPDGETFIISSNNRLSISPRSSNQITLVVE